MKRLLITILLLSLVSCAPVRDSPPGNIPTATTAMETVTATAILPQATQTQTMNAIVQRDYDPAEWKQLYNKDRVVEIGLDLTQRMWIYLDRGEIAFFDGGKWALFSGKDYGFPEKPYDMAIAPDDTVWLSGRHAISRYQNGRWDVFPMPNVSETAFPRLAIDPSGVVWVATPLCDCENSIKRFNGTAWDELSVTDKHLEASQLLFTPDGTLWASFGWPGGVGQYDGKTWKIYPGTDLWPTGPYSGIRIASDNRGNIFGIYERQKWVIRISSDESISKIPFDASNLVLNPIQLRLFIDKQDTVWINACLKDKKNACLAYYKDNQWVSFTNLPFGDVTDINELADGTLLVAATEGLYQFKSAK